MRTVARQAALLAALLAAAPRLPAQGPRSDSLRALVEAQAATAIELPPARSTDIVWLARDVVPFGVRGETWVLGIVTTHSGIEGAESACEYRAPWPAGQSGHGLWVQRWRVAGARVTILDSVELAAQVDDDRVACTPPAEIQRRFADATAGLQVRFEERNAVWRLASADSFTYRGRILCVSQRVDSTAASRRLRICFTSPGWSEPRCVTIATRPGENYQDRVQATVAVVHEGALWIFGLRTFGEVRGEPIWHGAWPSVKPVHLGRVPISSP